MSQVNSVTGVLEGVRGDDSEIVRRLWNQSFDRLVGLIGARLPRHTRRAFDVEDVALSAFYSFCARVGRGQFNRLDDRDDLWRLISTIAARKACALIRRQNREERGESALIDRNDPADDGIARLMGREPTPADVAAAAFAESCERLLDKLPDPTLRAVALRRLEGHSIEEIAAALAVAPRTVDRNLQVILSLWEREGLE
jgi:DNA-directed RNA polymerase specialized sigma24 family protein